MFHMKYQTISTIYISNFPLWLTSSPPSKQNVLTGSHAQLLDYSVYSRFTQPLVRWYDHDGQDECCTSLSDITLDEV